LKQNIQKSKHLKRKSKFKNEWENSGFDGVWAVEYCSGAGAGVFCDLGDEGLASIGNSE